MYNKKFNPYNYIIIIIFIIICFGSFIYFFFKFQSYTDIKKNENFKIIEANIKDSDHKSLMRNLYSLFGNYMFLVSGRYIFAKTVLPKEIRLFQNQENKIYKFPFISPNLINDQSTDNVLITGYKSVVNNNGDFCFINSLNLDVDWDSKISFIQDRIENNTFFSDDKEKNDNDSHYSHFILTRYLFKESPAIHVNYIVKKQGINVNNIISLIKFLNYIKKFINDNKISYFSISGNANITSAKWRKIIYNIFKDLCYISPGIESHFITDNDSKHGATANRFILVSKSMAPFGVYFYLTHQKIDFLSTSNILVAEILKEKKYEKNINDDTELIYEKFIKQQKINPSLRLDYEVEQDVDLEDFDMNEIGSYIPKHEKTLDVDNIRNY